MNYKANQNIIYSCKYHVIWCPKYRRKVLVGAVEERLKELVLEISKDLKSEVIEVETDEDHIHILVEVDPQFGIGNYVRKLRPEPLGYLEMNFLI